VKKAIITILSVAIFTVGCATYPPAKTENGIYTNPKCEFSIKTPDGWDQTDNLPANISRALPIHISQTIQTLFTHRKTGGYIVVGCIKSIFDFRDSEGYELGKFLTKHFEKQAELAYTTSYVKSFDYEVYNTYVGSSLLEYVTISTEIESSSSETFKTLSHGYWHSCHMDDTCSVDVCLISESETFDNNLPAFESVVESLTGYVE